LGRDIAWPQTRVTPTIHNTQPSAVAVAEVPGALALFAWSFKDQLIQRLDAEIVRRSRRCRHLVSQSLVRYFGTAAKAGARQAGGEGVVERRLCAPAALRVCSAIVLFGHGDPMAQVLELGRMRAFL
jgi:hypothetical protein